jgi:serine/threonine protein phosphatase PrpC
MKVEIISEQGSALRREDGLVAVKGLYAVLDGISFPYSPSHPPLLFQGMSSGELVVRLVEKFLMRFHFPLPEEDSPEIILSKRKLKECILHINHRLKKIISPFGELAGATFAITKIDQGNVEVVQTGDCMAVIELKDGEIIFSPNQVREHDKEMHEEIERLQREIAKKLFNLPLEKVPRTKMGRIRLEMWDRFYDKFYQARKERVNNPDNPLGFGLLNGQKKLAKMIWEKSLEEKEIKTILMFSDGLMPFNFIKSLTDEEIAKKFLSEFKKRGLIGLVLSAREEERKTYSYSDKAEITAIAIEF